MDNGEFRRQQTFVVELMTVKTNLPTRACYGMAGKWLREFGFDLTMKVLQGIVEGASVGYVIGALQREKVKTVDFSLRQDLEELKEAWTAS